MWKPWWEKNEVAFWSRWENRVFNLEEGEIKAIVSPF